MPKSRKYVSRYIPIRITRQREKQIKERHFRLITIGAVLSAFQSQAIAAGLSIEEKSIVMDYEHELENWINEDIQDWLILGGSEDYRKSKQFYELAKALRKSGYYGLPVI